MKYGLRVSFILPEKRLREFLKKIEEFPDVLISKVEPFVEDQNQHDEKISFLLFCPAARLDELWSSALDMNATGLKFN